MLAKTLTSTLSFIVVTLSAVSAHAYKVDLQGRSVALASLDDFDNCARDFGDGDMCLQGLRDYITRQPKLAFEAGKRARLQFSHWTALPFFAKAFAKNADAKSCADPDVSMAVLSGLALPSENPNVSVAKKIAGEHCWAQLQTALTSALNEGGSYLRTNACPIAAAKQVDVAGCKSPVETKAAAVQPPPSLVPTLEAVNAKQLTLDPSSVRALRGREGEEVLTIRTKPGQPAYVLLKFKSFPGPWNGRTFVAVERPGGVGKDYVVAVDRVEWVALTERYEQYQAYAKDARAPIDLALVSLDRGQKQQPTPADIAAEFGLARPAAATPAKPAASKR